MTCIFHVDYLIACFFTLCDMFRDSSVSCFGTCCTDMGVSDLLFSVQI